MSRGPRCWAMRRKPYFRDLLRLVDGQRGEHEVYPPAPEVFLAFHATDYQTLGSSSSARTPTPSPVRPTDCASRSARSHAAHINAEHLHRDAPRSDHPTRTRRPQTMGRTGPPRPPASYSDWRGLPRATGVNVPSALWIRRLSRVYVTRPSPPSATLGQTTTSASSFLGCGTPGRTGGHALTPEGDEFGLELRFSRYKKVQATA